MKTLILFHANCTDGAGAAWSAWKHFGDNAEYVSVGKQSKNQSKILKKCKKADIIFMCDMMMYYHQFLDILDSGTDVHLLDHHVTNMNSILGYRVMKEKIDGESIYFQYDWATGDLDYSNKDGPLKNIPEDSIRNVSISILEEKYPGQIHDFCDMGRSGAGITWDHFHGGSRPAIIDYVEDFDLWHWALPKGESIHVLLSQYNWNNNQLIFDEFDRFATMSPGHLAAEGAPLVKFRKSLVQRNMSQVGRCLVLGEYEVPILNTNHFISETGNLMAEGELFAIMWQLTGTGSIRISIRSNKEDGMKLVELSGKLGVNGGGHLHAAGTTYTSFEEMEKQIKFL